MDGSGLKRDCHLWGLVDGLRLGETSSGYYAWFNRRAQRVKRQEKRIDIDRIVRELVDEFDQTR